MCMDLDGKALVLHRREQRARIAHRCTECHRMIDPGETYLVERIVFDGDASSHKICAHCREVRGYLVDHCGGWVYTALEEDIQSHFYGSVHNDSETRELRLLAVGISARWRRADGSLWPVPNSKTPNVEAERLP